jgi:hypothetical protein
MANSLNKKNSNNVILEVIFVIIIFFVLCYFAGQMEHAGLVQASDDIAH